MKLPATGDARADQLTERPRGTDSSTAEWPDTRSQALCKLIEQQPFFNGLNSHHLQLLTESALEMQFEAGQMILEEGSPANRFYLILEGKVALESEMEEHRMIPVQTIGPGEDLGWSWLFPPYSLHSTARALEPTKTIFFYGTRLREQCEQDHDLGYELMKRIAQVAIEHLGATQQCLMECRVKGRPANEP
jgi:CRP/FNR family cyclic AMP-dependent transcriptional regulator